MAMHPKAVAARCPRSHQRALAGTRHSDPGAVAQVALVTYLASANKVTKFLASQLEVTATTERAAALNPGPAGRRRPSW